MSVRVVYAMGVFGSLGERLWQFLLPVAASLLRQNTLWPAAVTQRKHSQTKENDAMKCENCEMCDA